MSDETLKMWLCCKHFFADVKNQTHTHRAINFVAASQDLHVKHVCRTYMYMYHPPSCTHM